MSVGAVPTGGRGRSRWSGSARLADRTARNPAAIPHLLDALDRDHECDALGHSPASTSATALDDILGTNQTRLRYDGGFCSLAPWPPDYDALRTRARAVFREWEAGRGGS